MLIIINYFTSQTQKYLTSDLSPFPIHPAMRNRLMPWSITDYLIYLLIIDIIIMQEALVKSAHSSHFSEDYESISSQEQLDFTRQEIRFPPQPTSFPKIYDIYIKSTEKINKLHQQVKELEEKILELERCKENSKYDENALEVLDEIEDQSEFMINYADKCQARQKELLSFNEIYSGLKRLNSEIDINQNLRITDAILKYLQSHRKIVCYTSIGESILVVCREVHRKRKNYIASVNALNKSASGDQSGKKERKRPVSRGSKDEAEENQEKEEVVFSLRLLNTQNLIHSFQNQPIQPIIDTELTPQQLEEIKNHAQKEVNIMKVIKISPTKKVGYISATYSSQDQCYILLDQLGKLVLMDLAGEAKSFRLIDKIDKVVAMQIKNHELWVGTSEGVLRVYSLKDQNIKLLKMFGCFSKDVSEVSSYLFVGDVSVEKVLFTIYRGLFELNISTYQIKQVSQIADKVQYIIDKYLITSEQICKLSIIKDKYQISRNQQLNKWYYDFHSKNIEKKILHIQATQKLTHIMVGDPEGNINVISI